jgi:hypothetical protein
MAAHPRRKKRVYESVSYSNDVFRPYTAALGQIALAWNGLHSAMAMLFCTVMGGGMSNQFPAIWHTLKNDGAQRDILQAAAKDSFGYASPVGAKVFEEITWINGQARKVSDARDDALHSPLWGFKRGRPEPLVVPVTGLGHVRAKKLADAQRGLLTEFRWCRDSSLVLTDYVKDIDELLCRDPLPLLSWPERPSLPNRGQTKNDRKSARIVQAGRSPRPPSSPA